MKILIENSTDNRLDELGNYLEQNLNKVYVDADEDSYYDNYDLTFNVVSRKQNKLGQDYLYCNITLDYPNGNKRVEHFFITLEPWSFKYADDGWSDCIFRITSNDTYSPYALGKGFNSKEEVLDFIKEVEHLSL